MYNKKIYLASVISALAKEGGSHSREYIFVDDGSTDHTLLALNTLKRKLPGSVRIISRANMGASYSTNEAVLMARGYWIRLLDGDDLIAHGSTAKMFRLAKQKKEEFVYGLIYENKITDKQTSRNNYVLQTNKEGLRKFIRNCPANSSCIFLSVKRFLISGGCDQTFVSPDQMLFLRLFSSGKGVFLKEIVAKMPNIQSDKSLSKQIRRSRYESILALIKFCEENNDTLATLKKIAFKRALSRAHNYNRLLNKKFISVHYIKYLISKFYFSKNYINLMYDSLKVFTNTSYTRKKNWRTGFEKKLTSKIQIREY